MSNFLIVNLVVVQAHQLLFLEIGQHPSNCHLDSDAWSINQKHFSPSSSVAVRLLQTEQYRDEVREFSTRILHKLSTFGSSFSIEEQFLAKNRTTTISDDLSGFVIIVWTLDVLEDFLDQVVLLQRRAKGTIFILSHQHCHTAQTDLDHILRRLWTQFSTFNIILQTPCSCNGTKIYTFLPFERVDHSWGKTLSTNTQPKPLLKFHDLNQFPLQISMFSRYPYVIKPLPKALKANPIYSDLSHSKGFGGVDAFILGALAKRLNFDPQIVENFDEEPFGRILSNGTAVGSLADVVGRKVEFSSNGRFLKDYGTGEIEFVSAHDSDQLCMAVPKAFKVPVWKTLLNCFSTASWCAIGAVCIVCIAFWNLIRPSRNISQALWEVFAYFAGVPFKLNPSYSQFLFLTSCLIFNLIIFGIIEGSFFTSFTTTTFYQDIDTLEDLYESGLPIATNFWFLVEDDKSDLMARLKQRVVGTEHDPLDLVAFHGNVATLARKQDLELLIPTKYSDKSGTPLIHTVSECHTTVLLADILPKDSVYYDAFNWVVVGLFEGGFTSKWYRDIIDSLVVEDSVASYRPDFAPCTLYDIQAAFLAVLTGYFCSILTFLVEIVCTKKNRNQTH
jgi:hypothetical protein